MAKQEEKNKKARRPQAQKRDIQNAKRKLINKTFKSKVRTAIRQLDESIEKGNADLSKEALTEVYSLMDKGVKRGVYKQNKADRTKARLTARTLSTKSA
jgi:small subunit ribosomal protein S20